MSFQIDDELVILYGVAEGQDLSKLIATSDMKRGNIPYLGERLTQRIISRVGKLNLVCMLC